MRLWVLVAVVALLVSACEDFPIGPTDLAVSPGGDRVYVAGGTLTQSIWIVDTGTNQIVGTISLPNPLDLEIAPDGTLYALDIQEKAVYVIDPRSRTVLNRIQIPTPSVGGIGLNGAATRLYVISDPVVLVYDTRDGRLIGTLSGLSVQGFASAPWQEDVFLLTERQSVAVVRDATITTETELSGSSLSAIATDASGMRVFVSDTSNKRILVVDPYHRRLLSTITLSTEPFYLMADPTGSSLYVRAWNGDVIAVALPSGRVQRTLSLGTGGAEIAVHPSGSPLYVLDLGEQSLLVLEASTLARIAAVKP